MCYFRVTAKDKWGDTPNTLFNAAKICVRYWCGDNDAVIVYSDGDAWKIYSIVAMVGYEAEIEPCFCWTG